MEMSGMEERGRDDNGGGIWSKYIV
jgi:hypothetical protein